MFEKIFPKRGSDGLTNRERSNNSEYNKKVYCKYCDYMVRQGGHEKRCRRNGPSREQRRADAVADGRHTMEEKRAFKKFISNQEAIKQDVLDNYNVLGASGEKERNGLFAFVLPMGCGKTTICEKHGFIDIDSCGTSLSEREGIAGCVKEMVSKRDWFESMRSFATEVDANLDCMALQQKTLILVHDDTMARFVGAEVIGGCTLTDDALKQACAGRTKVQLGFADINNNVVRNSGNRYTELDSVSNVEAMVIKACNAAGIASGSPGIDSDFGAPGYLTTNEKVLCGSEKNLEMLAGLYSKFRIPAESVIHAMAMQHVKEYQGFGGTSNELAKILSMRSTTLVRLVDKWADLSGLIDLNKDIVVKKLETKFCDDPGYLTRVVAHWLSVGSMSENPEIFFRLYNIGKSRWNSVFKQLTTYLSKSRFWFGKKLKVAECERIVDMRFLMRLKGQHLCTDIRKVHSQIVTSAELSTMIESTEIIEPITFDEDQFIAAREKCVNADAEHADYMSGGDEVLRLEKLRLLNVMQMTGCLLMANHSSTEFAGIWRAARCDTAEAGGEWDDVLTKLNKLSNDTRFKFSTILATMLHTRVSLDGEGSLMDFLKYMQEFVTNGKVCILSGTEHGQPANVIVSGGEQPYCTTTMEDDKWLIVAKDMNADWSNVLWISSQERMKIEKMKAMKTMSKSLCLSIRDLIEAGLTEKEYAAQCAHVQELSDGDGTVVVMNAFGKRMYHKDEYMNMRKVMFTSVKDNGMGFRLPKGQVYRCPGGVHYTEKGGIKMPSYKKNKAEKKKQEGVEQTLINDIQWDGGCVDTPVSLKAIGEVGLSCGVYIIESCGNVEKMRKIVRW